MIDLKALGARLRAIFGKDTKGLEAFEFDTFGDGRTNVEVLEAHVLPLGAPSISERTGFIDGWWGGARKFPINAGRIGAAIAPWCSVVHTTDMAPGTMAPLLKRWAAVAGEGAGAHFLIGKQAAGVDAAVPTGGIVQMVPITRNGNHAGGAPSHGWFKDAKGKLIHPNTHAVGIEIDNAGCLAWKNGVWVHKDSGKVIPSSQVFTDVRGWGWEKATEYQLGALEVLLDALEVVMPMEPAGITVVPNGTYKDNGCPEAALPWCREVGHWTLDPTRKSDPGPQFTQLLRDRAHRR